MNFRLLLLGLSAALFVSSAAADGPCWADERCVRITGVGLAAVRPGDERPHNLKQLAAIRAAKLEALRSLAEQACKIEFRLHYEFSSKVFEKVIGPVFSHIANTFVDAFVRRAAQVYGDGSV